MRSGFEFFQQLHGFLGERPIIVREGIEEGKQQELRAFLLQWFCFGFAVMSDDGQNESFKILPVAASPIKTQIRTQIRIQITNS